MSEHTQHTPGPWKASRRKGEEWGVSYPYEYGDWGGVQVWMIGAFPEADARLIAAAPDLLAACEAVLANREAVEGVPFIAVLERAVRKARGEAA